MYEIALFSLVKSGWLGFDSNTTHSVADSSCLPSIRSPFSHTGQTLGCVGQRSSVLPFFFSFTLTTTKCRRDPKSYCLIWCDNVKYSYHTSSLLCTSLHLAEYPLSFHTNAISTDVITSVRWSVAPV